MKGRRVEGGKGRRGEDGGQWGRALENCHWSLGEFWRTVICHWSLVIGRALENCRWSFKSYLGSKK
jgi:hypothetical protein